LCDPSFAKATAGKPVDSTLAALALAKAAFLFYLLSQFSRKAAFLFPPVKALFKEGGFSMLRPTVTVILFILPQTLYSCGMFTFLDAATGNSSGCYILKDSHLSLSGFSNSDIS
jgi:hypothetical protein